MTMHRFNCIQDYTNWTETVWYCATHNEGNNLAVMALGLSGECAEVVEQCSASALSLYELEKELGDIIYYWARIHKYFELESQAHFLKAINRAEENRKETFSTILIRLSEHTGHCCDVLKKYIRDNHFDFSTLKTHLIEVMAYILNIANIYNFDFFELINTNVGKIEKRQRENS